MFKQKSLSSSGNLIDGLPVPAQTEIVITLEDVNFRIKAYPGRDKNSWKTFNLEVEKVSNIQIMDERQIKQVVEQAAPGMILGAAAFGLLGAMVGGRNKTKEKISVRNLLIIDYISNGEKQIIIDISNDLKDSTKIVKRFHEMKPETVLQETIQL